MLDGFRRAVGKSKDGSTSWDIEVRLPFDEKVEEAGVETEPVPQYMAYPSQSVYDPSNETDYYSALVRASIAAGGRHAGQEIPVNWLQMILAGLEGRDDSVDTMLLAPRLDGLTPVETEAKPYAEVFPSR